jgi:2-isopropylmalate synthase
MHQQRAVFISGLLVPKLESRKTDMLKHPAAKYRPFAPVKLADRTWPDAVLTKAPLWCSVDLRDGNQALIEPMDGDRKLRMFQLLVRIGFKEIEVGFPSASQTDFDFIRRLIEEDLVPDDVTIQVLSQAREPLIQRTFEALAGAKRVIFHLYNATAPVMRRVVLGMNEDQIVDLAASHTRLIRDMAAQRPQTEWIFEYSPEMFSGTELEFSRRVVDAVTQTWGATPERKCIINLPSTVEHSTPNIFADMMEWMHRNIARRDSVVLSVHPHNDRGTGTAAGEFALMAGADRVEGCLFGNGERTGNVDLVNIALNLYSQGVSPGLDFSDIDEIRRTVEHCNQLPVHPRHPYVGDLVYTSFSGSHQDAIKKAFAARKEDDIWVMPYLPIDPKDLGRSYEAVIRVNSQSGKGGISYLLESEYGLSRIPAPSHHIVDESRGATRRLTMSAEISCLGRTIKVDGDGSGPIDAFINGFNAVTGRSIKLLDYHEHAVGERAHAKAVAYLEQRVDDRETLFGVGMDDNIVTASLRAIVSGIERAQAAEGGLPAPGAQGGARRQAA